MKAKPMLLLLAATLSVLPGRAAEKKAARSTGEQPATGNGSVKLVNADLKTAEHVFKKTPQGELKLYFHFPAGWKKSDQRPAILFFFGGGWRNGNAGQFFPQAEYFATRGLVSVRADYRISSVHHTTPDKCVEDAKSAMRWLRGHAAEFGVDPGRIISSGGSAGGHLAAAVACVPGYDSPDDAKVPCVPNAMVLFNPALNTALLGNMITNAAGGTIGDKLSPTLFLKQGAPPTIIFFGTADRLKEHGDEFLKKSKELGNRCEQFTAADMPHGFFNKQPWTSATVVQADKFLASLGYLKGAPTLEPADAKAVLKRAE
jgi:acetyl esterase/lipase